MNHNSVLTVDSLSKSYRNVQALKGISFTLKQGEIFAFLGPNGAGKTTSLRILLDIIKPDGGKLEWNLHGTHGKSPTPSEIGYLPEERGLYIDLPVIRSLVYLASIRGAKPSEAKATAMEWLDKFGLAARAKDKLQTLSKGNQQKVQFIASILHKPRFAVLDEPFSGLDPISQEEIIGYIKELNSEGTTVLLSSHQMSLVERIAHRVFLINNGQEVFYGSLTDLYSHYGHQQTIEVTLSSETVGTSLRGLAGVERIELIDTNRVNLTFEPHIELNQILKSLSQVEGLKQVRSHNSNLHDIFLGLVRNRK